MLRLVAAGRGKAGMARSGMLWLGESGFGKARQAWQVRVRQGWLRRVSAGSGMAGVARRCMVGPGAARHGTARQAWNGAARRVEARSVWARHGKVFYFKQEVGL